MTEGREELPAGPLESPEGEPSERSLAPSPEGPPGGRVFSLEDRPAPGLYFMAWAFSVAGFASLLIGLLAGIAGATLLLVLVGLVGLTVGLASAAGYQVLARRDRHPRAYRGPAPLIVFGVLIAVSTLLSIGLLAFRIIDPADPEAPTAILASVLALFVSYVGTVLLFVVRSGSLSWREMGWPGRGYGRTRFLTDVGYGIGMMILVTFAVLMWSAIVGLILGVHAPELSRPPRTGFESLAILVAGALVAPFGEEIFFRGFVLSAWQRDLGPRAALIRSSVLFAIVHVARVSATNFREGALQALLVFAAILPVGFVLGWLFQRFGIVASILGHVTYNSTLLFLARLLGQL